MAERFLLKWIHPIMEMIKKILMLKIMDNLTITAIKMINTIMILEVAWPIRIEEQMVPIK